MKPRNIGRYQIKAELNRGGMSVVYLAHDPVIGRDVAIKMLPRSLQDQPALRMRFEREAHTVAALEHPAIVPVYDFGEEDGQPYLVMRYMPGGSLADLLTYGRLNLPDAVRIVQRLAAALDEAHGRGVVHRDIKPGNILFDTHGEAFLTDFGIVKLYEGEPGAQTLTGSVVLGTPAYMSPEQALGKPIDRRSDVYSLGAVLYEMLTGVPPYKGPTSISVAMKHVVEPVPNPREYRPELSEACIAVVEKAMAKDPDARFATAGQMAAAFAQAVTGSPVMEPMMPPLVVRRKPQTTSNAAKTGASPLEPAGTTEWVSAPGAPSSRAGRDQRILGVAVAVVSVLLVVGLGVFIFALTRQAGNASQSPGAPAPPSPTIFATTPVVPTRAVPAPIVPLPDQSPTPSPTPSPSPTAAPEPVRLVVVRPANVRDGPSTQSRILTQLVAGTELLPIAITRQRDGDWYVIELPDAQRGYIFSELVRVINPTALEALPTAIVVVIAPTVPPAATPLPTATPEELLTPTETPTPTWTPTVTVLPSPTATPVPLPTIPTFTPTPTLAASPTPVETPTITPTVAPSPGS
jgi:serine/threonine protein kinase